MSDDELKAKYMSAKVAKTSMQKVEMVIPMPSGYPTCCVCHGKDVTHFCTLEITLADGSSGQGFGCMCTECAEPYVADIVVEPGAN